MITQASQPTAGPANLPYKPSLQFCAYMLSSTARRALAEVVEVVVEVHQARMAPLAVHAQE